MSAQRLNCPPKVGVSLLNCPLKVGITSTHTHTHTDRQTDRQTDASDLIICPMLCYSNGTDNKYYIIQSELLHTCMLQKCQICDKTMV